MKENLPLRVIVEQRVELVQTHLAFWFQGRLVRPVLVGDFGDQELYVWNRVCQNLQVATGQHHEGYLIEDHSMLDCLQLKIKGSFESDRKDRTHKVAELCTRYIAIVCTVRALIFTNHTSSIIIMIDAFTRAYTSANFKENIWSSSWCFLWYCRWTSYANFIDKLWLHCRSLQIRWMQRSR